MEFPVGEGNDGSTFRGSVAHGDRELYLHKECLHLLVQCRSAYYYLVESATEGFVNLAEYLFFYLRADNRCVHEHLHRWRVNFGEDLLAYDFLYHEGYSDNDDWLDVGERLRHNGR